MGIGKIIAIIGGVAAGATGAYNYSTTGCPLGTTSEADSAGVLSVQAVAVAVDGDDCTLGCSVDDSSQAQVSAEAVISQADAFPDCCSLDADASLLSVNEDAKSASRETDSAEAVEAEKAECSKAETSDG